MSNISPLTVTRLENYDQLKRPYERSTSERRQGASFTYLIRRLAQTTACLSFLNSFPACPILPVHLNGRKRRAASKTRTIFELRCIISSTRGRHDGNLRDVRMGINIEKKKTSHTPPQVGMCSRKPRS